MASFSVKLLVVFVVVDLVVVELAFLGRSFGLIVEKLVGEGTVWSLVVAVLGFAGLLA